jgi:hypothetical protein
MINLLFDAGIEIGKAIAKQIFKLWLKDSALAEDISSSLLDLIGSKTSDAFAKREGNRQFEKIGDKITKSILLTSPIAPRSPILALLPI